MSLNQVGAGWGQKHPMWRPLIGMTHYVSNPWQSYLWFFFSFSPDTCWDMEESHLNSHYNFIPDQCVFSSVHLTHHALLLQSCIVYCYKAITVRDGHCCWPWNHDPYRAVTETIQQVTKMAQLIKQTASFIQILSQNLYQTPNSIAFQTYVPCVKTDIISIRCFWQNFMQIKLTVAGLIYICGTSKYPAKLKNWGDAIFAPQMVICGRTSKYPPNLTERKLHWFSFSTSKAPPHYISWGHKPYLLVAISTCLQIVIYLFLLSLAQGWHDCCNAI